MEQWVLVCKPVQAHWPQVCSTGTAGHSPAVTSNAQLGQGGPANLPNASNKIVWHYLDIWHLIHLSLPPFKYCVDCAAQLNWSLVTSLPPPDEAIAKLKWMEELIKWTRSALQTYNNQTSDQFPETWERLSASLWGTFRYSESEFRIDWSELLSLAGTIVALLGSLTLKTIMFNADSNLNCLIKICKCWDKPVPAPRRFLIN